MNISIIGAGNGGQAIAGYLSLQGHRVTLYTKFIAEVKPFLTSRNISLTGQLSGTGTVHRITDQMDEAVRDAKIIFIVTTANAHEAIAREMAPCLADGQIVIMSPGRTGGAKLFLNTVRKLHCTAKFHIAEAQTLVYACRLIRPGTVNIIGIKSRVLFSALPAVETPYLLEQLKGIYDCYIPAENVLRTSLENIGAILHPSIVLLNAAAIDRGNTFYFYRDLTDNIADFIEQIDYERLAVGRAFGLKLIPVKEWIRFAYPNTQGNTFCELVRNNPGYYDILAPSKLITRQLTEDIPTGIIPIMELGTLAQVQTPIMKSVVKLCSVLLKTDFAKEGRTLEKLGIGNQSREEIWTSMENGE